MTDRFSAILLRSDARDEQPTPSLGEIGLNNFAPYLMNRIMARWNTNVAEELKDFDMTTTQMRALAVLSVSSSVTINELSGFAVTEQSTMSRTLDSLEEQGYIRRQPRPDDMRVRDVSITAKGRSAFEKVWPTLYRMLPPMFDGVEEDEYRNFLGTLHKVLRNIRKHDI
jgi:MarR family transcriptional regulator for hemolysin